MRIPEVELNFSNICGANCFMCSKPHGCSNTQFMKPEVFDRLLTQLRDIEVGIFQTSGNGECLLNNWYIDYLRILKKNFPDTPRWCYNNFSLMDKKKTDSIIDEHLIDKMHTRVESLDSEIFSKSSRLNFNIVMENIKYFITKNNTS